ncbi:MAG: RDD family protein, partial [Bradymonadaceae bacterium]
MSGEQAQREELRTAGFLRRLSAALIDALCPLLVVVGLMLIGALSGPLFRPPEGWFLSEWWLHNWLGSPGLFLWPVVLLIVLYFVWMLAWEQFLGRTPGALVLGIELVDRD